MGRPTVEVFVLTEPDGAQRRFIEEWARSTEFDPRRQYRSYSRDEGIACLVAEIAGAQGKWIWFTGRDGAPKGLVVLQELDWDSEVFGLRMGRLSVLCGDVDLDAVVARSRAAGFEHLAARVDASDLAAQQTLAQAGFWQADTVCRYVHELQRSTPEEPSSIPIRVGRPADAAALESCVRATFTRYPGRYWRDPLLRGRQIDLYLRWARELISHHVLVSVDGDDRPTGFLAWREWRDPLGNRCFGRGLGAVERGTGAGAYRAIFARAFDRPDAPSVHHAEFDSQVDNYTTLRVYQSVSLRYVLAQATWHKAL